MEAMAQQRQAALVGADGVPFSPFARDYRGLRRALLRAPWHGGVMKGCVRRTKAALGGTRYDFYIELPGHRLFVMAAAKLKRSFSAYYCVCMETAALSRDSPHYLGKLRAGGVGGADWAMYDNGLSEKEAKRVMAEADMDDNGEISYEEFIPLAVELVHNMYAKMEAEAYKTEAEQLKREEAKHFLLHGMM